MFLAELTPRFGCCTNFTSAPYCRTTSAVLFCRAIIYNNNLYIRICLPQRAVYRVFNVILPIPTGDNYAYQRQASSFTIHVVNAEILLTFIATDATPDDEREFGVEGDEQRSRKFLAA